MKRRFTVISLLLLGLLTVLFCASCNQTQSRENEQQSVFVFLSVRIKGNGNGSITAVAQNEFEIGSARLPVTLTVYYCENYAKDLSQMIEIESRSTEDLNVFQDLTITVTPNEGYYVAKIAYTVNNEPKQIQSDPVHYDAEGTRIYE